MSNDLPKVWFGFSHFLYPVISSSIIAPLFKSNAVASFTTSRLNWKQQGAK